MSTNVIAALAGAAWLAVWQSGDDMHGGHSGGGDPAPAEPASTPHGTHDGVDGVHEQTGWLEGDE